jgi:small subunit ribosomal protein S1
VTGVVKGGLSVDIGVRAFMPASRSGTHDASELEKLVEQEIRCRIIKLDVADEDVVVDRRAIAEDEERAGKERRFSELKEGDTVQGEVRSLTDYGAFVDIGGSDALLHVGEISWRRINKPSDVLSVGQRIEAKIIKIDAEKHRIAISLKQLQPHPWDAVAGKYKPGERVRGAVSRIADFGAFVELEPGIEGLIHISEMSWAKRVKTPSDVVKPGETVEAVILGVNAAERRISLGLKQALGDPWAGAEQKFAPGTVIEGPVTNIMKFGAFVQLTEGVEGMIHVSEISAEKRINHPQDVLRVGQVVKAQVLALDAEKRLIRLSMKQLVPTGLDEYLAEHKVGDMVTGRMIEVSGGRARVELGEGVVATCQIPAEGSTKEGERVKPGPLSSKPDLSSLGSMLQARWKTGTPESETKPEALRAGQIRKFRIATLDPTAKKIELELE